jgi:hypothetical protein
VTFDEEGVFKWNLVEKESFFVAISVPNDCSQLRQVDVRELA